MTKNRIKTEMILFLLCLLIPIGAMAKQKKQVVKSDREVWCEILYRMSEPVLKNMSEGKLQQNMQLELSPTWDGRDKKVSYMEAFGRLMSGIAPGSPFPTMTRPKESNASNSANGH